jgi:3-phosphoshikimate 1-carboxyvinyltransferase
MSEIRVREAGVVEAELRVPGDKSMSHRAALLAAISDGACEIGNFLPSEDCLHTLAAVAALGARCEVLEEVPGVGARRLRIIGRASLQKPAGMIDCGNSGTGMRLLAGLLAGQGFTSELGGDESLSSRPMGRIIVPLEQMGARVESLGEREGCAPLRIHGGGLQGIRYELPVASAQVKSAVMLAGLFAEGRTTVLQPAVTRDHTERMLEAFGVPVGADELGWISAEPGMLPRARDFEVPGDISSATFWLVVGAACPGNRVVVRDVGLNPTRNAVLAVLARMGADVRTEVTSGAGGEPCGTVEVMGAELGDCTVEAAEVPNLIDELPALAVAGALSAGRFEVRNARELRVKESDRIATTVTNLRAFGAEVEEFEDGFAIQGGQPLRGAEVECFGDHRIAMASAVAGLFASGETRISGTDCVATSYPGFAGHLARIEAGGGSPDEFESALRGEASQ